MESLKNILSRFTKPKTDKTSDASNNKKKPTLKEQIAWFFTPRLIKEEIKCITEESNERLASYNNVVEQLSDAKFNVERYVKKLNDLYKRFRPNLESGHCYRTNDKIPVAFKVVANADVIGRYQNDEAHLPLFKVVYSGGTERIESFFSFEILKEISEVEYFVDGFIVNQHKGLNYSSIPSDVINKLPESMKDKIRNAVYDRTEDVSKYIDDNMLIWKTDELEDVAVKIIEKFIVPIENFF